MKTHIHIPIALIIALTAFSCEKITIDIQPIENESNGSENIINGNNLDCVPFTDLNFKDGMLAIADADGDGEISKDEALTVTEIELAGRGIKNIEGIEWFSNVWKLNLCGNKITDASMLKELHLLHYLQLAGNFELKTVDISECSIFFEYLDFEQSGEAILTMTDKQFVKYNDYINLNNLKRIKDTRKSTDFTDNNKLIKVKTHTKGSGHLALVLCGGGYIDIDYKDGSVERIIKERTQFLSSSFGEENWEVFDVYYVKQIDPDRETVEKHYHYDPDPRINPYTELYKDLYNLTNNTYQTLWPADINEYTNIGGHYYKFINPVFSIDYDRASFYSGSIIFMSQDLRLDCTGHGRPPKMMFDADDILGYYNWESIFISNDSITGHLNEFNINLIKHLQQLAIEYKNRFDQFIHNPGLDDIDLLQ